MPGVKPANGDRQRRLQVAMMRGHNMKPHAKISEDQVMKTREEAERKRAGGGGSTSKIVPEVGMTEGQQIAAICGRELLCADHDPPEWKFLEVMQDHEKMHKFLGKLVLSVGKTETGKSYLTRTWLYHLRNLVPFCFCFTNTKVSGRRGGAGPGGAALTHSRCSLTTFTPNSCQCGGSSIDWTRTSWRGC